MTTIELFHTPAKQEGSAPVAVVEECPPVLPDGLMKYFQTLLFDKSFLPSLGNVDGCWRENPNWSKVSYVLVLMKYFAGTNEKQYNVGSFIQNVAPLPWFNDLAQHSTSMFTSIV